MRITNTQYLKKGDRTNVGIVKSMYDNKSFQCIKGLCHNVDEIEVYKLKLVEFKQ